MRDTGAVFSPFNAWLFLIGLETLHLRVPRSSENALAVAQFLKNHPKAAWVNFTGLPEHQSHKLAQKYLTGGYGLISLVWCQGWRESKHEIHRQPQALSDLANIGDSKSLVVIHPASTTHQQLTRKNRKKPEFLLIVRLSVGTEDIADIIADLEQALAVV